MKPVKRLEIVTESLETTAIIEALRSAGVEGYTVIRDVTGAGDRGRRAGDELTGVFTNAYILAACPVDSLDAAVEAIRPILQTYGGICLVSDALWIRH